MKTMFRIFIISSFLCTALLMMSSTLQDPWDIPAEYQKMENPTDPGAREGLSMGESLYTKNCVTCHGSGGAGDGIKAKELIRDPGDFTKSSFQQQSDGELFYKISFGRGGRHAYARRIPKEEDRWLLVNYMRTFK